MELTNACLDSLFEAQPSFIRSLTMAISDGTTVTFRNGDCSDYYFNVSLERFYTLVVPINNYIASSSEKGLKIWIGQKLNPQEINYIIFC